MRRACTVLLLAAALAGPAACEPNPRSHGDNDGSVDHPPGPDGPPADVPVALALDFTVTGCATFDASGGVPRCAGPAPMTLQFVPVSSLTFDVFRWDFGDGSAVSSDRAPSHTYALPGSYTVALIAGGGAGSSMTSHEGLVQIAAVPTGGSCQVTGQCQTGLSCTCGAAGPCGAPFSAGLCTATCAGDAGACDTGAVCVDLAMSAATEVAAAADPWRAVMCLASCSQDVDCASGQRCRLLPGAGTQLSWVKACFAAVPADIGDPCRDARGVLADSVCSTGNCADLGALGACSLDCTAGADHCPVGTACAAFADGRRLCLRECQAATDCDRDPLLGCEPAGAAGALGFTAPTGKSYCAPRTCASYVDCAPSGICASGHCVPKP